MNTLDIEKYGYPLAESYAINTDLALVRTSYQSDWRRQRRSFLHNASLVSMTWKLRQSKANDLIQWLEALPVTDFFECELLSGNDAGATCVVSATEIRRTSGIACARIPFTDLFTVSFEAETKEQTGFQAYANAVANQPPLEYPTTLPMPLAEGFTEQHGGRNLTEYSLTYRMNTATLAKWLEFAGFAGTAWFYHPMFSTNVACTSELLRYVSAPEQSLIAPDLWDVSITAETPPSFALLGETEPPAAACTYDSDITYNDAEESYDCGDGGVTPPQGSFTMPSGTFAQTDSESDPASATATCTIKLGANGSVTSTPIGVPAWVAWHTDAESLVSPGVKLNKVIEFSRNGVDWTFYTPTASGVWLSLKTDLWVRLKVSGSYSQSQKLTFAMTFNAEASVSPYAVDYIANCSMTSSITITATSDGVTGGIDYTDGQVIVLDPGDELPRVTAGILMNTDGSVISSTTGAVYPNWFNPTTIGVGANFWVQAVKSSGNTSLTLGRKQLSAQARYVINNLAKENDATEVEASWSGILNFYSQAQGGAIIATSTLTLFSKASLP